MDFWPLWIKSGRGDYDAEKTRTALARTLNITARDGGQLVGCLRILPSFTLGPQAPGMP